MAHFAEIDDTGTVLRVLVVNDADQHRGHDFLATDLMLGGTWIQCSYNGKIRKQFPTKGFKYDKVADVFISPQPFLSWTLDANHDWQPPIPMPTDGFYIWDENTKTWLLFVNPNNDPQPYPSWTLNKSKFWIPPVPKPTAIGTYVWDEPTLKWKQILVP